MDVAVEALHGVRALPLPEGLMTHNPQGIHHGPHISRSATLTEWMDASIVDEREPERRDRELDLYDPENPNQPPYTEAFLSRYRAAQVAR